MVFQRILSWNDDPIITESLKKENKILVEN